MKICSLQNDILYETYDSILQYVQFLPIVIILRQITYSVCLVMMEYTIYIHYMSTYLLQLYILHIYKYISSVLVF